MPIPDKNTVDIILAMLDIRIKRLNLDREMAEIRLDVHAQVEAVWRLKEVTLIRDAINLGEML